MAKKSSKKAAKSSAIVPSGGAALAVQARYDAASHGRRMMGWSAPSSGPNKAIAGLQTIRNRSRDAGRNEWSGASSSRVMTTNLVGTGIVCRPRTKVKRTKARLVALWDAWCEVADADGVLDFAGLQVLATRTWFQAGEVFARIRQRRLYDGLPVPMQVQLLEPDLVPIFDADSWNGMTRGNRIRQGIEFDRIGRRVAYWMYREHPGDNVTGGVSMTDLVRVPADQVMHIYLPNRPGQLRGVPESAPILAKLRSVMDFDDAVLTRQQIANLFTMFIERPMPTGADAGIDPLTGKTIQYDANGAPMAALEPGISQELLPGEKATFSDPPDAGANYTDFIRAQNLGIAAGQGTPYELMTGDIRDVSDRTLRVVINEFRRYCEQLQWTLIIPKLCKPVRSAFAQAGLLAGALTEKEAGEAVLCDWTPQGWQYIHPVQDVQGKQAEVEAGFRSRSSVIAERGDDPDAVDEERAEDQKRERGLGIVKPEPNSAGTKSSNKQGDDHEDDDQGDGGDQTK